VEARAIQLLTRQTEPDWWRELKTRAPEGVRFIVGRAFKAEAPIVMIARKELTDFRKEEFSHSKIYVLVDENWSAQNLKRGLATCRGALFLDLAHPSAEQAKVLQVALARLQERERRDEMMQMMRTQNRKIEALNEGLEKAVHERTLNEAESRGQSRRNIARVREIIGFIKDLSQLFDINDLLPLLRKHVREYHSLESPILFVPRGEDFGDFYYLRGPQTIRVRVRKHWTASARIRVNEAEDSQFLADALGRPFGKVLRFPLVTVRQQKEPSRSPLILFEHKLGPKELEPLVNSLTEKLQPVSWALDRLILEQELKGTSRDWETTFDELSEPIAILDPDGRILRSNAHWRLDFNEALKGDSEQIRHGDRLYRVEKYPIRMSPEAPPLSTVVYLRDETRSRKLKSQVVQVEKMSAIGQLAGHIAHELNNPLTGIRSLAQVLLSDSDCDSQMHKDLDEVERASARCQGIINNLLEFSNGGLEHKIQVIDLNEVVRRTLPFLKSAIGRFNHDIDLAAEALSVKVESHLMQQVIFNLVNNACQAMPEKGQLTVRTYAMDGLAFLEVKDSGAGIPDEVKERIFEPFFTTKAEGEGTGLGLSLSRDFVRQFGGEIDFESTAGHGSSFRVQLPLEAQCK
jgi:signal transduction histidine kinase